MLLVLNSFINSLLYVKSNECRLNRTAREQHIWNDQQRTGTWSRWLHVCRWTRSCQRLPWFHTGRFQTLREYQRSRSDHHDAVCNSAKCTLRIRWLEFWPRDR